MDNKNTFKDFFADLKQWESEDLVEDYMPLVDLSDESSVIVNLKEDTVDRIDSFRLTKGESLDNIIVRLLVMAQVLNNSND